ncbi:PIGV mannosyltransferase, partial [Centropus bengalensis]|nr:PIGV mannosyltransferase [Centropus bengalensis]
QALFNLLIPDHAAPPPSPPRLSEPGPWDALLEPPPRGLSRWDAEHFLFIAERPPPYEHNWAFFPLYPLTLRAPPPGALWPLQRVLQLRSRLPPPPVLLNSLFSILAASALYPPPCAVLSSRRLAFLAALLSPPPPANVFLAAAYSESMFSPPPLHAMWQLEKGQSCLSGLLFSLASGVRANGVINAGFLPPPPCKSFALHLRVGSGSVRMLWKQLLGVAAPAVLTSAGVPPPFAWFQFSAYGRFCVPSPPPPPAVPKPLRQLALDKGYPPPPPHGVQPPWCSHRFPLIPPPIQDVYWNVGFLRYFELTPPPNFLLALPVTILGSWAAPPPRTANPRHCLTLGLERRNPPPEGKPRAGFCCPAVFVYAPPPTVLLVFGFFCMHVQVLTRFLGSSSPVLYWFSAHLLQEYEPWLWSEGSDNPPPPPHALQGGNGTLENPVVRLLKNFRLINPLSKCLLGFFSAYWLLGLVLHCNCLPWT